eukprot:s103_g44.t1
MTNNSKRSRSRKAEVPTVEAKVVSKVLNDAGVNTLLASHSITRVPHPPPPRQDDDIPIEISSEEEEEETGDFLPTVEKPPTEANDDEDMDDDDKPVDNEGDVDMGGDVEEEQDEIEPKNDAKRRRKGIRGLSKQFEDLVETAETEDFGFVCGGKHQIEQCTEPGKGSVAIAFIKTNLETGSKSPLSKSGKTTARSTQGRKDKLPKSAIPRKKRWARAAQTTINEVETCEYSQPADMSEIGDRADGGEMLVNDVDISQGGPGAWYDMELLIERASAESPPIAPTVKDCVEGRVGYRRPADSKEAKHLCAPIRVYTGGLDIGK